MVKTFEMLPPGPGFVKTEGLNFRSTPGTEKAPIRELDIGEAVDVGKAANDPRWRAVTIGGVKGFAASRYLRPLETPEIEALLHEVIGWWLKFDRGDKKEELPPHRDWIGEMWRTVDPKSHYDGASKYPNGEDVPWSAAFISHCVRHAGTRFAKFRVASGHSVFINQAIQARLFDKTDVPFWGYRIAEKRPELGDIVARNRAGYHFTYDYAETHSQFKSHSDVVAEVTANTIIVIGGNVSDSADTREYRLDPQGFIAPGQDTIALLKNRAALC